MIGSYNGTHSNLFEDYGTDRVKIPFKFKINTSVEKEIPAVEEGEEAKEKTPEEIQEEIVQKFRENIQQILESHQKVLDQVIEENIEVVREEVEDEKAKAELEANEEENKDKEEVKEGEADNEKEDEETKEVEGEGEIAEGKGEIAEGEGNEEDVIGEHIGLHPTVVSKIYSTWKTTEKDYSKKMISLFTSVRKQHSKILEGIEQMKEKFKEFLMKPDLKQDKLDHFIESFNKFTKEFPELRPDEQTKEELNNR